MLKFSEFSPFVLFLTKNSKIKTIYLAKKPSHFKEIVIVLVGVEGWLGVRVRRTQESHFYEEKIVISPAKSGVRGSSFFLET